VNARRNYSDAQWLRLAEAVEARPAGAARSPRRRANIAIFAVLTPLAAAAAFLHHPRHDGCSGVVAAGEEEIAMKSVMAFGVAAMVSAGAYGQNLLINGGLEGSTPSPCNGFVTLGSGSTAIPAWQVNGTNSVDWNWARTAGPCCDYAPEGDRTVDLNGSPAQNGSAIRQTISTVAGARYRITLLARANECCSAVGTTKILRVTAGDSTSEYSLVVDGLSGCDFNQWSLIERVWTATATQSVIELRSLVPSNAGGPIVDDVRVILVECPGDITRNGTVDGVDLALILSTWGTNGAQGAVNCDLNNDGVVDGMDLATVLGGWGACP
jgi:hypothetical protein